MSAELIRARRAVLATFVANGLAIGSWASRVPAVRARAHIGDGALGLALAALAVGAIAGMLGGAGLTSRHGTRTVTRTAVLGMGVALGVISLGSSLAALLVLALCFGTANGTLDNAMNAHGVLLEEQAGRPLLGGLHAGFSAGALAGGGLGALAAGAGLDVRVHLAVAGAACVLLGARAGRDLLRVDDRHRSRGPVFARPPRALVAIGLVAFAGLEVEGAVNDWSAVYIRDDLGAGSAVAALGFTVFSVAMVLGRSVADGLTGVLGAVTLLRAGGLLAAAGFGAALLAASPPAAIAGCACLGLGMAAVVPTVFRASGRIPGVSPGVGLAATTSMGYTGFLVGPPVVGALASATSLPLALGLVVLLALGVAAGATSSRAAG